MSADAFTSGVKPGGLNSKREIRILLCYLLNSTHTPVTMEQLEGSLWGEELVNYFELAVAVADLCDNDFIKKEENGYVLMPKGKEIAESLSRDVAITVKETALRAVIHMQRMSIKQAQHKTNIEELENGYRVTGWMEENGEEMFKFSLYMPDLASANFVKKQFILHGDAVYAIMLSGVTANVPLINTAFKTLAEENN